MSKSIPILAFAIAANAIPWPGPSPTTPGAFAGLKRSAAPTLAPRRPSRPGDHLFRRASTDAYKICGSNVGDDGNSMLPRGFECLEVLRICSQRSHLRRRHIHLLLGCVDKSDRMLPQFGCGVFAV
ncbi:hypothetical protein K440DRAFT_613317 [Wilcoxina mikolae CBS 423.85]|nr:hypothetical protein K440DRAFT_613317 [Wilcoxina mikolae CBS 423.85]